MAMNTVLLLMFTLFTLASFGGILWTADPYTSGPLVRSLFFVTLFFVAMGVFALGGMLGSRLIGKPLVFGVAFRRGLLLAMLTVAIVALEAGSILNITNAFAVFLLVVTMEMMAVYKK